MDKTELIECIREINKTAKPEFLAKFSEKELNAYLEHLMELNPEEAGRRFVTNCTRFVTGLVRRAGDRPRMRAALRMSTQTRRPPAPRPRQTAFRPSILFADVARDTATDVAEPASPLLAIRGGWFLSGVPPAVRPGLGLRGGLGLRSRRPERDRLRSVLGRGRRGDLGHVVSLELDEHGGQARRDVECQVDRQPCRP